MGNFFTQFFMTVVNICSYICRLIRKNVAIFFRSLFMRNNINDGQYLFMSAEMSDLVKIRFFYGPGRVRMCDT